MTRHNNRNFAEFIALSAMMMSLVALAIDTMLPALPVIGRELGAEHENAPQLVISLLFLGMSVGQVFYGPISDSIGRKPAIYAGFVIFLTGTLLSLTATSFHVMLVGRVLQGLGAAGPRVVTMALVRDRFKGADMARVMSFIMTIFILVPIVAPALGQVMLDALGWRSIFGLFLVMSLGTLLWFVLRQPETLPAERRHPFSLQRIGKALREIIANPQSLGCTLVSGFVFGAFLGYLNSSQQIFQELYGLGSLFPLYFGVLASTFGAATLVNTRLVQHFSLHSLVGTAMNIAALLSLAFLIYASFYGGQPPLWALMLYLLPLFFTVGLLFGNLNAMAMEPLGHIAGIGAAAIGSISTGVALICGTLIGQAYDGTLLPMTAGYLALTTLSLPILRSSNIVQDNS
ncbi:multidrug effflux MFS transporter [Prosthecochloris vibrioformis]|uniref:Multidrug effflux MFS transporter n=1 Tax=Prosthecochloris vibrioformis TaxID=1098 RepID=A0A5C4RY56_PROVB|nr:multidrug effflux MFS transporter [Prosthecochloris vibrioformis]TNJ35952.1 multidrug effflux MFS transporter [Prosthecochloris vibrioformis]